MNVSVLNGTHLLNACNIPDPVLNALAHTGFSKEALYSKPHSRDQILHFAEDCTEVCLPIYTFIQKSVWHLSSGRSPKYRDVAVTKTRLPTAGTSHPQEGRHVLDK